MTRPRVFLKCSHRAPNSGPCPAPATRARRAELIDAICRRLEAGESLRQIARDPHAPTWNTLWRWRRADPALQARIAEARAWGRVQRFQARHADCLNFPSAAALALIERVRAGERLIDLVAAGRPNRKILDAWKRLSPDFARDLAAAIEATRRMRRRRRDADPPYDEATGDAIAIRVRRGETLRQVCRDPAMPAFTVVRRWRSRHPGFDAALRAHKAAALRTQAAARGGPTTKLTVETGRRLAAGASLENLCARPDMPDRSTLYRWRRERPDFAAQVEAACRFRDDLLADRAFELRVTDTPAAHRKAAKLAHRRGAMRGRREAVEEG